jgi:hypothetical protein
MSILTNKMPNLTTNAKLIILSKLEEGWSIRTVHRAEDKTDSIMLSNLSNLYKKYYVSS